MGWNLKFSKEEHLELLTGATLYPHVPFAPNHDSGLSSEGRGVGQGGPGV